MKVETQYSTGQDVYFVFNNRICKGTIGRVLIEVCYYAGFHKGNVIDERYKVSGLDKTFAKEELFKSLSDIQYFLEDKILYIN